MAKIPPGIKFVVGIDEAGRGPLAGPVAVGAVVVKVEDSGKRGKNFTHPLFKVAKDSKMLSAAAREKIYIEIVAANKEAALGFVVSLVSATKIDSHGIVPAIRQALHQCLKKLAVPPHETLVLLDGSLHAPEHFLFQKTIIRGDQTEPLISLASIAAKVTRDRHMTKLAKKHPQFGFEIHKGYGTLLHREMIKKHGLSAVHRRSFLKGFGY